MVYLVTKQQTLFNSEEYDILSVEDSIKMIESFNMVQFDLETSGRDCRVNTILCAQFGNKDIQIVVDCTTINIVIYKDLLESKFLIGQNLKFDLGFLYNHGIVPLKIYDTFIVEQFLYLGYSSILHGYSLSAIAYRYLNINIDKSIRGEIIWRGLDTSVILYAANDVKYLEDIMNFQLQKCREQNCMIGAKLECDFVPVIAYLEWCGIKLDVEKWKQKMLVNEQDLKANKQKLDALAISWGNPKFYTVNLQGDLFNGFDSEPKCTVNWSSSKQVIQVAKYLGFNTTVTDKKTGKTKESVLEKIIKSQKGINDEFLKVYFDYQEASKVCSTYGQNYIDAINPNTGRIHTVFRQLGATSGRMSCGDSKSSNKDLAKIKKIPDSRCKYVQLQNLPADEQTRSAFISENNNLMCSCDYSALEARLGADIYNEPAMLEEFLHGSGDMHSLCAKMVFQKELQDIDVKDVAKLRPDLRKKVKAVEFAKQFGGTAHSISESLGCSLQEAEVFSKSYDEGFKGVTAFKIKGSKFVRENGYIIICQKTGHKTYWAEYLEWKETKKSFNSAFWDRYRQLCKTDPENDLIEFVSSHFKMASKWDRMSLNSPTQGSGIIILKDAMTQFFYWIIKNKLFGKVLLCNLVHDEAVIEFPKTMPEVANILSEIMETSAAKYCTKLPIPAEPAVGDHWIH